MHFDNLNKDESIKDVISKLYERLGENSFDIVDHWKDDSTAIGIGSPSNHKILAYISTYGNEKGIYDIHLELAPTVDDDFPYEDAGQFNFVNFEKLVEILCNHFKEGGL